MKLAPTKAWTIIEIRDLGGNPSKNSFIDYSDLYGTKKAAQTALKEFGMPQDFKIIPVIIKPLK